MVMSKKVEAKNSHLEEMEPVMDKKMFSLLIDQELLWKLGIVAAHEKKKKKDIILSLLVPYINNKYSKIFDDKNGK